MRYPVLWGTFFLLISIDRITKQIALSLLDSQSFFINTKNFSAGFTPLFNYNYSFGLAFPHWIGLPILIATLLVILFYILQKTISKSTTWALILMLAGGSSNLWDRFLYHGVIDFINFEFWQISWPVFNFADIIITLGIIILLIQQFKPSAEIAKPQPHAD